MLDELPIGVQGLSIESFSFLQLEIIIGTHSNNNNSFFIILSFWLIANLQKNIRKKSRQNDYNLYPYSHDYSKL